MGKADDLLKEFNKADQRREDTLFYVFALLVGLIFNVGANILYDSIVKGHIFIEIGVLLLTAAGVLLITTAMRNTDKRFKKALQNIKDYLIEQDKLNK